jgi:hypothetical protein
MYFDKIPHLLFTRRLEFEKAKHKFEFFEKGVNKEETPGLLYQSSRRVNRAAKKERENSNALVIFRVIV